MLGIDIGTSTVKACVVERNNERIVCEFTSASNSSVQSDVPKGDEQSVEKILTCIDACVDQIADKLLARVVCVAICGQMHGCVLWKGDHLHPDSFTVHNETTNLITWQDGRCTEEFLHTLPKTTQYTKLSTGYGCASLAWLQSHRPSLLAQYDTAGTIMDLFVCKLCGLPKPVMTTHNANSWGYFDLQSNQWELELYVCKYALSIICRWTLWVCCLSMHVRTHTYTHTHTHTHTHTRNWILEKLLVIHKSKYLQIRNSIIH